MPEGDYETITVRTGVGRRLRDFRNKMLAKGLTKLPRGVESPKKHTLSEYLELAIALAEREMDKR